MAASSPSFVGSEPEGDGFVGAEDRPPRKRQRAGGSRDVVFAVAPCSTVEGTESVKWWGVLKLRWSVARHTDATNSEAHREANRRATRPSESFIDYLLESATWCDRLVLGEEPDVVPVEVLLCCPDPEPPLCAKLGRVETRAQSLWSNGPG